MNITKIDDFVDRFPDRLPDNELIVLSPQTTLFATKKKNYSNILKKGGRVVRVSGNFYSFDEHGEYICQADPEVLKEYVRKGKLLQIYNQ